MPAQGLAFFLSRPLGYQGLASSRAAFLSLILHRPNPQPSNASQIRQNADRTRR
jgi:hypothetical protein